MSVPKQEFYSTERIRRNNADFNIVVGERSNGKSTAVLMDIVKDWHENGRVGAVIRQMELDIQGHRGDAMFNYLVSGGHIHAITGGEWDGVKYYRRAFYLTKEDPEGDTITQKEPFAYAFAISQSSHSKSISYPNIGIIFFDEFIPEHGVYIADEFARFQSLLSTLVRGHGDKTVFLVANTVTWNSLYLRKYAPQGIAKMKPGEIAVTEFKKSSATGVEIVMRVAIEYCDSTAKKGGKASDKYFIIDDDRAKMIVDGQFAIPAYPACPHAFTTRNVKARAWITTDDGKLMLLRLIRVGREVFLFCETIPKNALTFPDPHRDLFYEMRYSASPNHFVSVLDQYANDSRTKWIAGLIGGARIFFSSVETGEDFTYYANRAAEFGIPNL